jgi:hypothetical protein
MLELHELRMEGRVARMAAYGAYAVTAGLVAVLGFLVWLTWPVSTGGMNSGMAGLTWIVAAVIVLILGGAHIALAQQLMGAAKTG